VYPTDHWTAEKHSKGLIEVYQSLVSSKMWSSLPSSSEKGSKVSLTQGQKVIIMNSILFPDWNMKHCEYNGTIVPRQFVPTLIEVPLVGDGNDVVSHCCNLSLSTSHISVTPLLRKTDKTYA
jgi:hypothetical protein